MKLEIHTDEGAGPVKFGMTPEEVRKALKAKAEVGQRGGDEEGHPYDYFEKLGCFVYYDASGKAEAMEFAAGEDAELMLEGEDLLGLGYKELVEHVTKLDRKVEFDESGFKSTKLGIGCYAPGGEEEPEEPAEGIMVFRRGYYESHGL